MSSAYAGVFFCAQNLPRGGDFVLQIQEIVVILGYKKNNYRRQYND